MSDPEMWLSGSEDGCVVLTCSRRECGATDGRSVVGWWHYTEDLPYYAQPSDVVDAWEKHKAAHGQPQS